MSANIDDALQTYIVESMELLQQMEEALLETEHRPDDPELINAIFRAAHTIKGSAGLFSLDHIVEFTHVAESVLDQVRDHRIILDGGLNALFLEVCDHLGSLMDALASGQRTPSAEIQTRSTALAMRLDRYLHNQAPLPAIRELDLSGLDWEDAPQTPLPVVASTAAAVGGVASGLWHVSLRSGPDLLRNGMDPLSILRYLNTFGQIVSLELVLGAIPPISLLDPESCYLGFELSFASTSDRSSIEGAFDFVREDSLIRILEPYCPLADYRSLFADMPEDSLMLGEMLVRCGSLTREELEQALRVQEERAAETAVTGEPAPRLGEVLVEQQLVDPPLVEAALERQQQGKLMDGATATAPASATAASTRSAGGGADASLIRVDAAKLDQLINLVGELIIAGAGAQLVARRVNVPELVEATGVLSRLVEDVRDSALTLRMVQIGATFNRFRRVVRDVAAELGKDIQLDIRGGETELDKTVVEKIGDPLTHIVRNALDHGIESADVRRARGKSAQGRLGLNAYHESGSIVIEVTDDGGGLKKERILRKAIERGLVSEGQILSDKEIFNLVFEPGFSTAEQISNLSGRGVGMDVVKRNIQALRGTVDLESVEGQGTTVRIRLPLTLAIIDGFLIGAGPSSYVVPLEQVVECIELPEGAKENLSASYLNLRGEVLPFIRLRDLFEIPGEPPRRENVVVVQYAGERAGLVVDQLFGEFQTVIKPLGKVFSHIRCIGGSTILGSGEVALILDVPGLVRHVTTRDGQAHLPKSASVQA
ncbi:chemotaxis protein CheA [Zoogloea sp.]|uniref:chemotaxis protein CheA n=1 Tax=Zoogloea sp. TaxID=49181 RepID=UPI0035B215C5